MRFVTNLKRDTSLNVAVAEIQVWKNWQRSRHEMTNLERQSLMDISMLRWTVCALMKLANSSAEVALSPRRCDEISLKFL